MQKIRIWCVLKICHLRVLSHRHECEFCVSRNGCLTAILAQVLAGLCELATRCPAVARGEIEAVYMYVKKAKRKEMYKYKAPTIVACRNEKRERRSRNTQREDETEQKE